MYSEINIYWVVGLLTLLGIIFTNKSDRDMLDILWIIAAVFFTAHAIVMFSYGYKEFLLAFLLADMCVFMAMVRISLACLPGAGRNASESE